MIIRVLTHGKLLFINIVASTSCWQHCADNKKQITGIQQHSCYSSTMLINCLAIGQSKNICSSNAIVMILLPYIQKYPQPLTQSKPHVFTYLASTIKISAQNKSVTLFLSTISRGYNAGYYRVNADCKHMGCISFVLRRILPLQHGTFYF